MKLKKEISDHTRNRYCISFHNDRNNYLLAQNNKEPLFCKKGNVYWDGGSYECFGFGYKVNVYKNILGKVENTVFGSWNLEFNKWE